MLFIVPGDDAVLLLFEVLLKSGLLLGVRFLKTPAHFLPGSLEDVPAYGEAFLAVAERLAPFPVQCRFVSHRRERSNSFKEVDMADSANTPLHPQENLPQTIGAWASTPTTRLQRLPALLGELRAGPGRASAAPPPPSPLACRVLNALNKLLRPASRVMKISAVAIKDPTAGCPPYGLSAGDV